MTKLCSFLIFLSLINVSLIVDAATLKSFPPDLLYANKPIDSLCFGSEERDKTIDLRDCGLKHFKYINKGIDEELDKKGYIGYRWEDPSLPSGAEGHSFYKFFKANNQHYWIYSFHNTGGSGEFTYLSLVRRINPHTLKIQDIVSGDRCNGGIDDVTAKNSKLTYSINLTPYDLLNLSARKIKNLKAYDDVSACATCCIAKVFYTLTNDLQPQFKYVELMKDMDTTPSGLPVKETYQACFNKIYLTYIRNNNTHLDQQQIDRFIKKFKAVCLD